jgi:hypothetical protein
MICLNSTMEVNLATVFDLAGGRHRDQDSGAVLLEDRFEHLFDGHALVVAGLLHVARWRAQIAIEARAQVGGDAVVVETFPGPKPSQHLGRRRRAAAATISAASVPPSFIFILCFPLGFDLSCGRSRRLVVECPPGLKGASALC